MIIKSLHGTMTEKDAGGHGERLVCGFIQENEEANSISVK
jgi:hypothetical protein